MQDLSPPKGMHGQMDSMLNLSAPNYSMLVFLNHASEPMTITQIAEKRGLHLNSVRETVENLYALGLISRNKSQTNTRGRPSWVYFSISPQAESFLGVFVSKFIRTISDIFRMTSSDPRSLAYKTGTYWAGMIDSIIIEEIRKKLPKNAKFEELNEKEQILLARNTSSVFGHSSTVNPEKQNTLCINTCPFIDTDGTIDPLVCEIHRGLVSEVVKRISNNTDEGILYPKTRPGVCEITIQKVGVQQQ